MASRPAAHPTPRPMRAPTPAPCQVLGPSSCLGSSGGAARGGSMGTFKSEQLADGKVKCAAIAHAEMCEGAPSIWAWTCTQAKVIGTSSRKRIMLPKAGSTEARELTIVDPVEDRCQYRGPIIDPWSRSVWRRSLHWFGTRGHPRSCGAARGKGERFPRHWRTEIASLRPIHGHWKDGSR